MNWKMAVGLTSVGLFLGSICFVDAQRIPGIDSIRKRVDDYSVQKLVQGEPAITTSLSDAVTDVPFLDDYNPQYGIPLSILPLDKNGRLLLVRSGLYASTMQTYCLRAGTYGPGKGQGYIYGPLKGKQSGLIRAILQRSALHPEVPQSDIQVLIWAILSKTKITDMSRSNQQTAATLLTSSEISDLKGSALGMVADSVLEKALNSVSPELRPILEAEAKLRKLLSQRDASYATLERVAVLEGEPSIGGGSRAVPRGRWSYHPDGYFVRYFPKNYSATDIQIYVPERLRIERDALNRICLIADRQGNQLDWEYDDQAGWAEVAGDPTLRAYGFKSIHYKGSNPARLLEKWQKSWEGAGWAFQAASGTGTGTASNRFSGFDERRRWGEQHRVQLNNLATGVKSFGKIPWYEASPDARNAALSLAHLAEALSQAIKGESGDEAAQEALYLVKRAWMTAVAGPAPRKTPENIAVLAGFRFANPFDRLWGAGGRPGWIPALLQGSQITIEGPSSPEFVGAAIPANTASQRLASSPRPSGGPPCAGVVLHIAGDVRSNGQTFIPGNSIIPDMNGMVIETGSQGRISILMQDGSKVSIGSKSKISFDNICRGSPGPSYVELGAGAARAIFPQKGFDMKGTRWGGGGIRGELHLPHYLMFASLSVQKELDRLSPEEREEIDMLAAEDEGASFAPAVAIMINHPEEFIYVKVTKGKVRLVDSNGSRTILNTGEYFFRNWSSEKGRQETLTVSAQP